MRKINKTLVIAMFATVCTIVITPHLYAQNTSDSPNMPASAASGRSIGEFLTPDGRFDLEAARRTGFYGSLNMNGFESNIDTATGRPVFRPAASASPAEHPDDIYWDNSMSPSITGVDNIVSALTVYNGKLIAGGGFTTVGGVEATYIAAWDGSSWSPLGSGLNGGVSALTMDDGKLIAGGGFITAGGNIAPYITGWTKKYSPIYVEQSNLQATVKLSQNYPNPFNPVTSIGYDVPSQSRVILTIYNVLGQPVRTLIDETQQAGSYRVTWDGTDQYGAPVSMGVYFIRLQAGNYSETKKMLLLK